MPRVVFTHAVSDVDHWASKHSERVQAFSAWGSNVVDYVNPDGSNNVGVTVDVHDMGAMQMSMQSAEMNAGKEAHGVLEPVMVLIERN